MRTLLLCVMVVAASTTAVNAQIINTLRGFGDDEPGWAGRVEGIVALADGNSEYTEFEGQATVQYRLTRQRFRWLGRYMKRTANDIDIAESRLGHLRHSYEFLPWFSSVLFVQGQYDPFRRLETRLLAGGGGRFDVLRSEHWSGAIGGTYMFEREELTDIPGTIDDHRFSFFASIFSAKEEAVTLDISAFYQPLVNDFSDARAFVAASVRVDVTGGLYFLTAYNLLHDSNPPEGVLATDQSIRSGLGFEF